jgi:carbon-monoxide dehydrogenase medium subunit
MNQFLSPSTIDEALTFLKEKQELRILAGGTDLIIAIKNRSVTCAHLMDVKQIPELQRVEMTKEGLEIGAAVSLNALLESDLLKGWYRAIAQSAASVANSMLRNRATLVGNICNASPGGDMLPSCLVANAVLHSISPDGGRVIPLRDFFVGVKEHVLAPHEMATKIVIPHVDGVSAFCKKKRIRGHDIAQVSVAASYSREGVLRMAFGAAAPTPLFMELGTYPSGMLRSQRDEIVDAALKYAMPISDVRSSKEYRLAMLKYLANEVLDEILEEMGACSI